MFKPSSIRPISILLFGLILSFCSCRSNGTMPQDPFVVKPLEEVEKEPSGSSFTVGGSMEMSIRGQAPGSHSKAIQQVDYAEVDRNDSVASEQPVLINRIIVEPSLSDRGPEIIERQQDSDVFIGSWRPPGMSGVWPQSEYLADGGDRNAPVYVEEDWNVRNLGLEDTVAHFDTLDGRTLVEPSNRVHVYAPRFGSVRKVEGIINNQQVIALSKTNNQLALNIDHAREQLGFTAQETKTGYARTRDQLGGIAARHASSGAAGTQNLGAFDGFESVMFYSNWLRQQAVGAAEMAYLADGSLSARAWQGQEGVKVQMNSLAPMAASSEEGAESFFQIDEDSKTSKLRLIKVADKKAANPGEIVEFTLRFDNVGNQPIGNVTILDNLTTRLEFLPGTAKSSLPSGFVVEPNEGGSFILRFEITDPLQPNQFGVVQFRCRVR